MAARLWHPQPLRVVLTTTATTELVPASKNQQPIGKIYLCNTTAAAVTIELEVFDGTTSFFIEKGRSIPANGSFELRDELLQANHSLRAKASAANAIHAHIIAALTFR
ncbi:hypothetical protein N8D56_05020 [Devosia sp. A8/3-2]|nr:hypothetical protein N8D56_05020 [Devosia sp. A8/3-2]